MSRYEAIMAIKRGARVTHRYFTYDEWISYKDGKVLTEDGYMHDWVEFWRIRDTPEFDKDWSIHETSVHV